MELLKEIFTVIGAIVAVLTGLITLYAKYIDLKKRASRREEMEFEDEPPPRPARRVGRTPTPIAEEIEEDEEPLPPPPRPRRVEPATVARARSLVRGPAVAMIGVGILSLAFNLFFAGFGFVNDFVTPLGDKGKQAAQPTGKGAEKKAGATPAGETDEAKGQDRAADQAASVMMISMMLCFALASAAAIWAGCNMLRLRSYWLSVAGSFAIMPGACCCLLAGFPIGIWSLFVLLKPDVSASFR